MRYLLIFTLSLLMGCTIINRRYFVYIEAKETSTVNFTTEILADIDKEAESKTDANVDATVDMPVIP